MVPKEQCEIKIHLSDVCEDFLDVGFTVKGYGFSVKSIYLD